MTAAPSVPIMQASGTFFFGFSTASEFCAADSIPRNAHNVSEMLDPMPWPMLSFCGFQASLKVVPLNQNQPMIDSPATGINQIRRMTPMQVAIGADDNQGKNAARYPTAEIAMATLPMASDTKYRKNVRKYPSLP